MSAFAVVCHVTHGGTVCLPHKAIAFPIQYFFSPCSSVNMPSSQEISAYTRGGTVHVFVTSRHGMGLSVRCMRPYDEYRQFTPNPEGGARSNATLFDNPQQKNSEYHELRV